MSDSKKDGRRGGGHRDHQGREYWSRRPGAPMGTPGKASKRLTHRAERRVSKEITAREANDA